MQFGDRSLEVEIERAQVIAALEPHYVELLRLVQSARVAGMQIQLRLAPRIAAFPGLVERFGTLRDCEIRPAARCRGARSATARSRDQPPRLARARVPPADRRAAGGESIAEPEATPTPLRPTHLLFQGRAWRISDQPLVIGWSTARSVARCCCRALRPAFVAALHGGPPQRRRHDRGSQHLRFLRK